MGPRHPEIKRIMQEQVGQYWADHAPLRGSTHPLNKLPVLFHGRRQPSFDVEQRPFVRCVLPDCLRQKFVVDVIKRTFLMSELEHDGLKLNRFAAAPSIDSLVSRARVHR